MLTTMLQALLGLALGLGSVSTHWTNGDTRVAMAAAEPETQVIPSVRVEIKLPHAVLKSTYQPLVWDEPDVVELTRGEHRYRVTVTVSKRDEAGAKLTLTLAYEEDGQAVIAPLTFDTREKKREIVSTDGVALAVTVKRKTVPVESTSTERKEKLAGHDSDDPLAGLE